MLAEISLGSTNERPSIHPLTWAALAWLKPTVVIMAGQPGTKKQLPMVGNRVISTTGETFKVTFKGTSVCIAVVRSQSRTDTVNKVTLNSYGTRSIIFLTDRANRSTPFRRKALFT